MRSVRSGEAARFVLIALSAVVLSWAALGDAQPGSDFVHFRRIGVEGPGGEPQLVNVIFPRRADRAMAPDEGRYALVLALHDIRGTERGPLKGPMLWAVNFELAVSYGAFERGHLERRDYNGFVTTAHLDAVNGALEGSPFAAPVVACPYVPDFTGASDEELDRYADWIEDVALAAVREEFSGVARGPRGTGIDGIGSGGRIALEVGLRKTRTFSAVGAIQPSLDASAAASVAERVDAEAGQAIRLVTSEGDPGREATVALSRALRERSLPHTLVDTPGTHDIEYGRGAGAIELLRFHTAALVREADED